MLQKLLPPPPQVLTSQRIQRCIRSIAPIARQLSRASRTLETDDLTQLGILGLLEAQASYAGPAQDFNKHAQSKILAAITQGIAALELPPPALVRTMRRNGERGARLAQILGRPPTSSELAAASGMTISAYQGVSRHYHVRRSPRMVQFASRRRDLSIALTADPLQAALHLSDKKTLRLALAALPKRDKQMLHMHYRDNMKLKEIGAVFGVCESRVCQLLTQTLSRLRQSLNRC